MATLLLTIVLLVICGGFAAVLLRPRPEAPLPLKEIVMITIKSTTLDYSSGMLTASVDLAIGNLPPSSIFVEASEDELTVLAKAAGRDVYTSDDIVIAVANAIGQPHLADRVRPAPPAADVVLPSEGPDLTNPGPTHAYPDDAASQQIDQAQPLGLVVEQGEGSGLAQGSLAGSGLASQDASYTAAAQAAQ